MGSQNRECVKYKEQRKMDQKREKNEVLEYKE